jgi:hypothetical protein
MVLKLFRRQCWYVRKHWVLLHFCFSLYWNKLPLELLWALFKLFFILLCLYPLLFKWFLSWPNRFFKDLWSEQLRLILRAWLMLIYVWEHFKKNCSNRLLKDRFLGTYLYKMWIWSGLRMMKNYRAFFHVPITYIPLSSSLMKYRTLPFPSSTLLVLYRKVNNPQIYSANLPTTINTFCLAGVILLMWLRAYHNVPINVLA